MIFHKGKKILIAGPCAIESESTCIQVADTLATLKDKYPQLIIIFKSSFDKANRMSSTSARGIGLDKGLEILAKIKKDYGFLIVTDIHESHQAKDISTIADVLQIPAFLCRQTDLLVAAAKTGKTVNLKKGQFLSPHDMQHLVKKLENAQAHEIWQTERGTTFGYGNLVVDMKTFPILKANKHPVIFDVTHSVQLPGAAKGQSGGEPQFIPHLAQAAIATGCLDGLFMETHPNPSEAISDKDVQIPLKNFSNLLERCMRLWEVCI